MTGWENLGPAHEYFRDAWQRSVLFMDVLRQRGNIYLEQQVKTAPNVLDFDVDLILDGRTLPRPVSYGLVRISAPKGIETDNMKRPFVVVDPRAGHGPGIGGMKEDSEIGVALRNGHPCYFIGFLPEPMPEQTIEDVWNAEAAFVAEVSRRHPASGKPAVVGNCQAGWQTMIMAAVHPDVPGPLLLAGSPLSYWAGVRGKNPMRYLGGMLGGTWLTAMAGDLGSGTFDGANLVANFEALDPANTLWDKPYNVYANVDTEVQRFLDFETWWGSPILLNAGEMQWIADNLFVGNKLTNGKLRTSDGVQVDLRNIKSPIIVFCSWGDNITPPQQALGWVTDIYDNDDDLITSGQTIVYSLHQSVGHLGIFVSGKVATKEHDEFTGCMDMIDLMPPGLYEAVIEEVDAETANRGLVEGNYLFRLEPRKLADIRALGGNSDEDDLEFATVERISNVNRRLYENYLGPSIRAMTQPAYAEATRKIHPNRLRFSIFSDENPMMQLVATTAEQVRKDRKPTSSDNMFVTAEKAIASSISDTLTALGKARDTMTEQLFHMTYGAPALQALVGIDPVNTPKDRKLKRDMVREKEKKERLKELEGRFEEGGAVEAALRSIAYIRLGEGSVDERGYAALRALHDAQPAGRPRTMAQLKSALRDQYLLLRLDEKRAVAAIPKLLPRDDDERGATLRAIGRIISSRGKLTDEGQKRLAEIEKLFAVKAATKRKKEDYNVRA